MDMSDMRFVMIGIVLVFAGFIILGTLGGHYSNASVESGEFDTCYKYSDENPPVKVDCADTVLWQTLFFSLVIGLIGSGIMAMFKGMRGDWDSKVRPEDMVGPGKSENQDDPK